MEKLREYLPVLKELSKRLNGKPLEGNRCCPWAISRFYLKIPPKDVRLWNCDFCHILFEGFQGGLPFGSCPCATFGQQAVDHLNDTIRKLERKMKIGDKVRIVRGPTEEELPTWGVVGYLEGNMGELIGEIGEIVGVNDFGTEWEIFAVRVSDTKTFWWKRECLELIEEKSSIAKITSKLEFTIGNVSIIIIKSKWDDYFHILVEAPDEGDLYHEHRFVPIDTIRRYYPFIKSEELRRIENV